MSKYITKQHFLDLIEAKLFKSEKEFEFYIRPMLIELFNIKESQLSEQETITSFDGVLSNRADIIIKSDEEFPHPLVVIELKLENSIKKFQKEDFSLASKQLHKYCQQVRSPYGILLTDQNCFMWSYKYYTSFNTPPQRIENNKIPTIKHIENELAAKSLIGFVFYDKSAKYIRIIIIALFIFVSIVSFFIKKIFNPP